MEVELEERECVLVCVYVMVRRSVKSVDVSCVEVFAESCGV